MPNDDRLTTPTRAARRTTTGSMPVAPPPFVPPPRTTGSLLATVALGVAFVCVLVGLWATEQAIAHIERTNLALADLRAAAAAGLPAPVEDAAVTAERAWRFGDANSLRLAAWFIGFTALGAVIVGLAHERRLTQRVADRSAELERLSGELIQVNRTKSEFLANVSHELRTPLNAIVGFVDLLADGVYGPLTPRQSAPVQRLAASAAHLRQLVDQILDLAKISAGRLDVHPEPVQLRPFVLDVATELEPLVQARGLALSLAVPASLPTLHTDPTHLRQILVNLMGNAIKFTPEGRITVRAALVAAQAAPVPTRAAGDGALGGPRVAELAAELAAPIARAASAASRLFPRPGRRGAEPAASDAPRQWVALQVVDTGIGIPKHQQQRIFDEFEQIGPRTGDSAVRGTGLGLAISRRLARLLGGDLTVESEPGHGATFTLWLRADEAGVMGRGGTAMVAERARERE